MSNEITLHENEIILYTTPDGGVRVEVVFQDETFWMTINRIAELFGTTKQAISYNLQNIYDTGELKREATVKEILTVQNKEATFRKFRIVQQEEGRQVNRNMEFYNQQ